MAIKKPGEQKNFSPLAADILAGFDEYAAHQRGEKTRVKTYLYPKVPDAVDVKAIRAKLGMTQEQFTSFGFSLSAIRHWEAARRQPEGSARLLLKVIEHNPKMVLETLHG